MRPSYLYNGNSYNGALASLYWINPRIQCSGVSLCDWLSLRCLVQWINRLSPIFWSTYNLANCFERQLVYNFYILDNIFLLLHTYILIYILIYIIFIMSIEIYHSCAFYTIYQILSSVQSVDEEHAFVVITMATSILHTQFLTFAWQISDRC